MLITEQEWVRKVNSLSGATAKPCAVLKIMVLSSNLEIYSSSRTPSGSVTSSRIVTFLEYYGFYILGHNKNNLALNRS